MKGLIGCKIGMTRIFTADSIAVPVTVIEIKKNYVTQIKNLGKDGYFAIQVTTGEKKRNKVTKSEIGHFIKAGVKAGRGLWEFRIKNEERISVGDKFSVDLFSNLKKVDVTSYSKGKGFAGTIKRWNFHTQDSTHGNSLSHRTPGSIGQNQTPGKVFKGKKMAGQLGNQRVTIQNLEIVRIDNIRGFLLIKGSIPGPIGSDVIVKPSIKI